jgi:uncharacterized membrane protein
MKPKRIRFAILADFLVYQIFRSFINNYLLSATQKLSPQKQKYKEKIEYLILFQRVTKLCSKII